MQATKVGVCKASCAVANCLGTQSRGRGIKVDASCLLEPLNNGQVCLLVATGPIPAAANAIARGWHLDRV